MKPSYYVSRVSLLSMASLAACVLMTSPVLAQRSVSGDSALRTNSPVRPLPLSPQARTLAKLRADRKNTTTQTRITMTFTNPNPSRNADLKTLKIPLLIERLDLPGSNAQPGVQIQKAGFVNTGGDVFTSYTGMFDVEVKNTGNQAMSEVATVYVQVMVEYSTFDQAKFNQTHNFDSFEKNYEPIYFDTASLGKLKGLEKKVVSFDLKDYQPKSAFSALSSDKSPAQQKMESILQNMGIANKSSDALKTGDKFFTGYAVNCGLIIGEWPHN